MRIRLVLMLTPLALAGLALAAPQVILETDFGLPGESFADINAELGNRITGSLPEGWSDNSGWKSRLVADYSCVTEEGRSFLRVTQTSGGGLQFTHALPGMDKEAGYYRLSLTARSDVGGSLGVRYVGAPYNTVWSASPAAGAGWHDFSYDFRLGPQPQEIGLYIYLSGDGTLDLQNLRLVRLSEQDLIDEIKARYPDAGQGNLVRLSRFPLGLQSGWSVDRDYSDGDEVQVESDPSVAGPDGCPALRIEAPRGIRLYSAPFPVPWSFETHVLSLSVRGDWEGRLIVAGGAGQHCATAPLSPVGAEWRRIELAFRPILQAPAHHLRIEGQGTLWIDRLQVEHGDSAGEYAPQRPVEVSLALQDSEASSARVVFTDEPARADFCVLGECPGAVLRARVVNLYGDETDLPPIALGPGPLLRGSLELAVSPRHPVGPQRLEAWVEDGTGQKLSAENELVLYRLRRPRHWGRSAPGSFFGTHTLSTNRHLTMAKAVGCNWVRLHDAGTEYIGWSFLEPEKGRWQFRDADLQRYRDHHLSILGLLSTTPGWASNWGKPCTGYFDRYLQPLSMGDWQNAVRTIVTRYRDMIDTYEIWNEPWGSSFWSLRYDEEAGTDWRSRFVAGDTPAEDYARLQKAAYEAAHEVYPEVTIVGFNTYGNETGTKWTREVLSFGGLETCDGISYHHYESAPTGMPDDPTERAYAAAMGPVIEQVGEVPMPVWMSEGAPLSGDVSSGFYRHSLPYENENDNWLIADRMARYVLSHRATGASHAFLYTMHGHSTFGGPVSWTTLVTAEGYLHPSAAAHSALAWLLEDTAYVRRVTLAEGVYAYLFAGADRAVAAITTAPTHAAYSLPTAEGVELQDLFGNPPSPGTPADGCVRYVLCPDGLEALETILQVR